MQSDFRTMALRIGGICVLAAVVLAATVCVDALSTEPSDDKSVVSQLQSQQASAKIDVEPFEHGHMLPVPATESGDESVVAAFSLSNPSENLVLPDGQWKENIGHALANIEETGASCSFTLVSCDDDLCVQYQPEDTFYSASCSKAVFCYYLLSQDLLELDEYTSFLVEAAIVYSDNDAYDILCEMGYYDDSYAAWLSDYGIECEPYIDYGGYLDISSASLCSVWLDIASYIDEATPNALWFADLLAQAEVSFIQEGIGYQARVLNKAGWIAEGYEDEWSLNATNDAGIVELDGRRYVLAITSSMPSSDEAAEKTGRLAAALLQVPYAGADIDYTIEENEWD